MSRVEEVFDHARAHDADPEKPKLVRGRSDVLVLQHLAHGRNVDGFLQERAGQVVSDCQACKLTSVSPFEDVRVLSSAC